MIKKIPYLIYALIAIIISSYFGRELLNWLIEIKWIQNSDGEAKVAVFSTIFTVLGLLVVVIQLQSQKQNDIIATEYLNQPNFEFLEGIKVCNCEWATLNNQSPKICFTIGEPNLNRCYSEHWFNLRNTGNLAAINLRVSLFHEEEKDIRVKSRIIESDFLPKNDIFEYKLPAFTFDSKFFNLENNGLFYVLISYQSQYSNIKYKRVYSLNYSPTNEKIDLTKGYWLNSIKFFEIANDKVKDSHSIRLKELLVGKISSFLSKTGIKPYFSSFDWVINF